MLVLWIIFALKHTLKIIRSKKNLFYVDHPRIKNLKSSRKYCFTSTKIQKMGQFKDEWLYAKKKKSECSMNVILPIMQAMLVETTLSKKLKSATIGPIIIKKP